MNPSNIHTENWQMSLDKPSEVVVNTEDVRQCIQVILTTQKGADPLRPHFGCGLADWVDKPVSTAIPNMKKEILEALKKFEKRIKVTSIKAEVLSDERD